jgi:hypothetical protein
VTLEIYLQANLFVLFHDVDENGLQRQGAAHAGHFDDWELIG